jgi:UDP-GlcNAc3NAcA epimerase
MPEEINRILTDRLSAVLFCPTRTAVGNLRREGIIQGVFHVGDVMYDAFLAFRDLAARTSSILTKLGLSQGGYALATVHRQENADDASRLESIFRAFQEIASKECPIVIPIHPRTERALRRNKGRLARSPFIRRIPPVHYLDMITLECNARVIMTDSGGVQKEAFFARTPCITLRGETEWPETVESGWNVLSGARTENIVRCFLAAAGAGRRNKADTKAYYGDGKVALQILDILAESSPFDLAAWKRASFKHPPSHRRRVEKRSHPTLRS